MQNEPMPAEGVRVHAEPVEPKPALDLQRTYLDQLIAAAEGFDRFVAARPGRRRDLVKAAILAAVVLVCATLPWNIRAFLWICGGLAAALFLLLAGALLALFVDYRSFARSTGEEADQLLRDRRKPARELHGPRA